MGRQAGKIVITPVEMQQPATHTAAGAGALVAGRVLKARLLWLPVYAANLMGALLVFALEYRLPNLGAVVGAGVAAIVLYGVVSLLPRRRAAGLGGVLAVLALVLWLTWSRFEDGAGYFVQWMASRLSIAFRYGTPLPEPTGAAGAQAFGHFIVLAILLWGMLLACTVLFFQSAWLNFVLTGPLVWLAFQWAFSLSIWPAALLAGSWMALLLKRPACIKKRQLAQWWQGAEKPSFRASGLWRPAAALVLCLLLVGGMLVVVPQDKYTHAAFTQDILATVQRWLEGTGPGGRANMLGVRSHPQVQLQGMGGTGFDDSVALRVYGAQSGLYLRGYACTVYTGAAWQQLDDREYDAAGMAYQPLTAEVQLSGILLPQRDDRLHFRRVDAASDYLHTPYFYKTLTVDGQPARYFQDAYAKTARDTTDYWVVAQPSPPPADLLAKLAADTLVVDVAERIIGNTEYSDFVMAYDTALPEGVAETMRALAADAGITAPASAGEWARTAQAVAAYVKEAADYTLSPPEIPHGVDAATWFLTTGKAGYCVHFATAAAVMLRALGVPARFAEGFLAPEPNTSSHWTTVYQRNAHAWVEIWLPGLGWLPVEVTPGGSDAERREDGLADAAPAEAAPEAEGSDSLAESGTSDSASEVSQPVSSSGSAPAGGGAAGGNGEAFGAAVGRAIGENLALVITLLALVVVALLVAGLPPLLRRRRWRQFGAGDRNRAAITLYLYLLRLEHFGHTPSATARRLAEKARFSRHGVSAEERQALLDEARAARAKITKALPGYRRIWWYLQGL